MTEQEVRDWIWLWAIICVEGSGQACINAAGERARESVEVPNTTAADGSAAKTDTHNIPLL